jgi:hypothetical protein
VSADLALETQPFRISGKKQLDRRRAIADSVVQRAQAVLGVNPLDDHHGHQDVNIFDFRRIPGEKRLDVAGFSGRDDEIDPIARDVDPGQLLHHLLHLHDHDAALEVRRFDNGGGILRVRAGIEISVPVRKDSDNQCDPGREVQEVAAEELEIGMDFADLHFGFFDQAGYRDGLRAGVGKVDFFTDSPVENFAVGRQGDDRLHHVKPVDLRGIDPAKAIGQKIGLLLVVPFQGHPVTRANNRLHQGNSAGGIDDLAVACLPERPGIDHAFVVFSAATPPVFSRMLNDHPHRITSL